MSSAQEQITRKSIEIKPARLRALRANPMCLKGLLRGIEKESLRVTADGDLSKKGHPNALGSPLTHPAITTDFSESQLELITGVNSSATACLNELEDVHRFVHAQLKDELLWPSSMPCIVGSSADIPIGQYGTSNIGKTKNIYRRGLGLRYGRLMQTISGIHYNFSIPEHLWQALNIADQSLRTRAYFDLIRNFRRWSWLLIYLFGASPAVCRSFTRDLSHNLEDLDQGSQYLPYATSLRMGPLGYQSNAQNNLHISYNSLSEYTSSMLNALTQNHPAYEQAGTIKNGEYQQLNTSVLQIENEFYGTIRPKRTTRSGERPVNALLERGVEYVEVRCLDLNPFLPLGLDETQINFIDTFLLLCLLTTSTPDSVDEVERITKNQAATVARGRDTTTTLIDDGGQRRSLQAWGSEILEACTTITELLDQTIPDQRYTQSLKIAQSKLLNPELTPSAQVLAAMRSEQIPFFRFSMNQAIKHKSDFARQPLTPTQSVRFDKTVEDSWAAQKAIESADNVDLDTFLSAYLALPEPPAAPEHPS